MLRRLAGVLLIFCCAIAPLQAFGETAGEDLERSLQLLRQVDPHTLDPARLQALRLGLADGLLADGQPERALYQLSCALQEAIPPWPSALLQRIEKTLDRLDRHGLDEAAFLYAGTPLAALADAALQRRGSLPAATPLPSAPARSLGVLLPLSGRYAVYGQQVQRGMELALAAHPGVPVRLVYRDTADGHADPAAQVAALAADPSVLAVIGPLTSAAAGPAAEQGVRERLPMLLLAQRDEVTGTSPYLFRDTLTVSSQIRSLLDYAVTGRGLTRFAVFYPVGRQGESFVRQFAAEVAQRGLPAPVCQGYAPGATDLRADLESLAKLVRGAGGGTLDALVIPDEARQVAQIVPQLGFSRLDQVQLLGTRAWSDPELIRLAGPQIEGAVFVDGFFVGSPDPQVRSFVDSYQSGGGQLPTILEAVGYDAAGILLSLLERGGIADREALRQALSSVHDYPGVTGRTRFDLQGEADKRLFLLQVQDGAVVQINGMGENF